MNPRDSDNIGHKTQNMNPRDSDNIGHKTQNNDIQNENTKYNMKMY